MFSHVEMIKGGLPFPQRSFTISYLGTFFLQKNKEKNLCKIILGVFLFYFISFINLLEII